MSVVVHFPFGRAARDTRAGDLVDYFYGPDRTRGESPIPAGEFIPAGSLVRRCRETNLAYVCQPLPKSDRPLDPEMQELVDNFFARLFGKVRGAKT